MICTKFGITGDMLVLKLNDSGWVDITKLNQSTSLCSHYMQVFIFFFNQDKPCTCIHKSSQFREKLQKVHLTTQTCTVGFKY